MGNAFGQSVFRNLFMYYCEKNEADGQPAKYLKWAQESAQDIIQNWDFNNPRHMWWIRNAEHITPSLKLRDPSMTLTKTDSSAHLIGMIKKWSPSMSIKNTSSWCCKFIDEYHGEFRKNIVAAEIEVFAQEYRRALCPKHLFNGENIFTKYRVGIDNSYN